VKVTTARSFGVTRGVVGEGEGRRPDVLGPVIDGEKRRKKGAKTRRFFREGGGVKVSRTAKSKGQSAMGYCKAIYGKVKETIRRKKKGLQKCPDEKRKKEEN